jgi:predicted Zn-dependent peptidase
VASSYRQLRSSFSLLVQLLTRDAYRGWQTINTDPKRVEAVTPADIQRVARTYLTAENKTVGIYYTKSGSPSAEKKP